ncbi:unnamed protein product [Penicillium palitans]
MEFNTDPNFDIHDFKQDPLLFTEEGIDKYCPGGFHPVSIGDKFHEGRYTVHHKLGFAEREQEIDEQTRDEIQEFPEQPQPEAPEGALDLPENHEQQLPAQDEITDSPNLYDDPPQDLLDLDLAQSPQQALPEAPTGTSEPLVSHEPQQPRVSEVCQSTEKTQSEDETRTSDLFDHRDEYQPASPGIPTNFEQVQLEVLEGAPDVTDNQGEQQPEVSDIPESFKRSELETAEDAVVSSEGSQQQEPRTRKRLRSRLGGLLNYGWRPWKRRRNS